MQDAIEGRVFYPRQRESESNGTSNEHKGKAGGSKRGQIEGGRQRLQIKETEESSDGGSIPGLISGSNSEEDFDDDFDDSSDDSPYTSSDSGDEDDEYDITDRERYDDFFVEVKEASKEGNGKAIFEDKYLEERKSNPFLHLLGNLKGPGLVSIDESALSDFITKADYSQITQH